MFIGDKKIGKLNCFNESIKKYLGKYLHIFCYLANIKKNYLIINNIIFFFFVIFHKIIC